MRNKRDELVMKIKKDPPPTPEGPFSNTTLRKEVKYATCQYKK